MAYKQAGPQIQQALAELLDYVRDAEEAAYRESRHRRGQDDYHYAPEAAQIISFTGLFCLAGG